MKRFISSLPGKISLVFATIILVDSIENLNFLNKFATTHKIIAFFIGLSLLIIIWFWQER